ncbi:MAG: HAMP domain-containing histidine kinase [Phycisphaerae bacterium]|nr:HAMP domain-containing histidine kinase [Phycisphaerae bacterium]
MNDPDFNPDDFLDEPVADLWTQAAFGQLASSFKPLNVRRMSLVDDRIQPVAEWGEPFDTGEMPQILRRRTNEWNLTIHADAEGRFSLLADFALPGGTWQLQASGDGCTSSAAEALDAALPAIGSSLAMLILLLGEHAGLVKAEARVRQLRNEHDVLETKHAELARDILVEHELRITQERDQTARLESEVVARTEQLAMAKERAERASKIRDLLLQNMSHELRTPLTAILGYTDLMLDDQTDAHERREFLRTIRGNAQLLVRLVDDVLDLAQMEAGSTEYDRVPCNIEDLVVRSIDPFASRARAKGLDLKLSFRSAIPVEIQTEPERLQKLVACLLDNAIKFTPSGSVSVALGMENVDSRLTVILEVVDTGAGIPADHTDRIFQPFHQVDSTTTRQYGGAGLGLAVARRIAEQLGGALSVRSEMHKGSTFRLTFPITELGELKLPSDHHWPVAVNV